MCGIAGLWAPALGQAEQRHYVEAMLDHLMHRGPDGAVVWAGSGITLGLARLAIVAPDHPVTVSTDETGTIAAVANAELYNYREIQDRLAAGGHCIGTGPDTTALAHLYEELGAELPLALDGMFAIAVWDGRDGRLLLARDRAGEKPLFIASTPSCFAFASEAAAILSLPWFGRDPNPAAISRYLAHGFFANGDSAFSAIRQLPPGHTLEVSRGKERLRRYWRPWDGLDRPDAAGRANESHIVSETGRALTEAVESRVPRDVPFGVFLSGGLDSSLVAALAARDGQRFPTFSLRLPGEGYDESPYAREVARFVGSEHHEISLDERGSEELLHRIAQRMDQPLGDPSLLPTWALSAFAAEYVRVVLTGEGGDELFAGYPTYAGHQFSGVVDLIPRKAASALRSWAHRFSPRDRHVSPALLADRLLSARGLEPLDRHLEWFGAISPLEVSNLLSPALRAAMDPEEPGTYLASFERALGGLRNAGTARPDLVVYQLMDFEHYLGAGILTKVDRATMAHGLESRAPFLRHSLIEFAMALPPRAKLRGFSGKWVLKRAARGLLPEGIIRRRKQGFSPPFSSWVRGPLRRFILSRLDPQRVSRAGVLDPAGVVRVLSQHLLGQAERGRAIWTLLSLQMWAEAWIQGRSPSPERHPRSERPAIPLDT
jgi:asparagine synthase (glutamine-hydrolysing)